MNAVLVLVLAYLLGSVNGALWLGRLRGGVDIRELGSGNAGGTNALRTQGPAFALGVVAIDIAKGWLAAGAVPAIATWLGGAVLAAAGTSPGPPAIPAAWLPSLGGLAAVFGHVYPLYHGFRGGKGAATLLGALAGLVPLAVLLMLGVWLLMMMLFGYVGLASILAAASLPVLLWALGAEPRWPLFGFAALAALLVLYTHRANLARMRAGTEPRARRLWLLGRLRGGARTP